MNDYANLRALPALLGVIFGIMSLYQFGAVSEVEVLWLDYTLTTQHATLGSLFVFVLAFASSQTKQFEHYEDWEKVLIAASPVVILGNEYVGMIHDLVTHSDPWTQVLAFLIAMGGYGVAMR